MLDRLEQIYCCKHKNYELVHYQLAVGAKHYKYSVVAFRCPDCGHIKLHDWTLSQELLGL